MVTSPRGQPKKDQGTKFSNTKFFKKFYNDEVQICVYSAPMDEFFTWSQLLGASFARLDPPPQNLAEKPASGGRGRRTNNDANLLGQSTASAKGRSTR